jgi:hypothetical protein
LKEAASLSKYSSDYIGQLIRAGKIEGQQVYSNIAWVTTEEAVKNYTEGKTDDISPEKQSFFFKFSKDVAFNHAMYLIIVFLAVLLLVFGYILSVSIDRSLLNASLESTDVDSFVYQ